MHELKDEEVSTGNIDDEKLSDKLTTGAAIALSEPDSLIGHGLEAVKHSLLLTTETDAESLFKQGSLIEVRAN